MFKVDCRISKIRQLAFIINVDCRIFQNPTVCFHKHGYCRIFQNPTVCFHKHVFFKIRQLAFTINVEIQDPRVQYSILCDSLCRFPLNTWLQRFKPVQAAHLSLFAFDMAHRLQGLLDMMEVQLRLNWQEEPPLDAVTDYIPCHLHSMLQVVRCLEELVAAWPPSVRRQAPLLKGFLAHGGSLIVKYIGMYRLKTMPEQPPDASKDIVELYDTFMDSFTTELEELCESVIAWVDEDPVDGAGTEHVNVLGACELALCQAIKCHETRHTRQLANFVDAIFRGSESAQIANDKHAKK